MVPKAWSADGFVGSSSEHVKIDSWLPVPNILIQVVQVRQGNVYFFLSFQKYFKVDF